MISATAKALMETDAIKRALAKPVLMGEWPEDADTYLRAPQPEAIGRALISSTHKHLANAEIAYLFRKKIETHNKVVLARASKAGGKLSFLAEVDLCIDVNHQRWQNLSPETKVALIDHELCHFGVEEDENGTRFVMIDHDVEEFGAIVSRWGLWRPDLAQFGRVIREQGELFAQREAEVQA